MLSRLGIIPKFIRSMKSAEVILFPPMSFIQPMYRFKSTPPHKSMKTNLNPQQFDKLCENTLVYLNDALDELQENLNSDFDVTYSDGILTIFLGEEYGTYVINKQSSNRQIWLSSPRSGPKRYDYDAINKSWIYTNDKSDLFNLLSSELSISLNVPVSLKLIVE